MMCVQVVTTRHTTRYCPQALSGSDVTVLDAPVTCFSLHQY